MAEEVTAGDMINRLREWGPIAHDIALLTAPVDGATTYTASDIAKAHGISSEQLAQLLKLPAFVEIVRKEVQRIKDMGPNAGARLRAEAMAMVLQEKLFALALSGELDGKLLVQFYTSLLKTSGLEEPPETKTQVTPQVVNNVLSFNVPRLPNNRKLSHLMGQPQTRIVDAGSL